MPAGRFADNQAGVNYLGNISTGFGGADDAQGDATHGYAKKDCWYQVPLQYLAGIPTTTLTMSDVRSAAGIYGRVFTSGGAITPVVPIYFPMPYRTLSGLAIANNATVQPHGFKLTACRLAYTIATLAATSVNFVFTTEAAQANNTARAAASNTPLGAVTYHNPPGTVVASLPVATQANPYLCSVVFATPVFITTERQFLMGELQLSLPNTTVFTLTELSFQFSYALY